MVLFLDERLVLRESSEQLRGEIGDPVEKIHSDREVCAKHHRPIATTYQTLDLRTLTTPPRRALNERTPGENARLDIPPHRVGDGEVDRNVRPVETLSHLLRRKTRVSVRNNGADLVPLLNSEP